MKKIIKRFIAFVFATALFLAPLTTPITTYAANSSLTYVTITDNSRVFEYRPDPLNLSQTNHYAGLNDAYTFQNWQIPAGKDFHFYVNLQYLTDYQIMIIDGNASSITYYNESNSSSFYIKIPAISEDNSYYIEIISYSTNAYVRGWGGSWQ
ncbi:hypothetical protein [Lachnoclostridium phytofermentans]|uniref:hypothetical protein n=1 Tax=Lachnoclostridium phytofermentans TaxID=66219 RepID=UPI000496AC41|nr:hypothetical protein [Lachnoclostridium phytofermentans]